MPRTVALLTVVAIAALPGFAQTGKPAMVKTSPAKGAKISKTAKKPTAPVRMVAYDARDHRYYPLPWAKAHQMRDPAGDPLSPLPINQLPKEANPTLVPPD